MVHKIGFTADTQNEKSAVCIVPQQSIAPRRSVVQVFFAEKCMSFSYYNDQFDLHRGDRVYVDGKLEGVPGFVTDVNYTFKIKLSDYKRVVALVDTTVHGRFFTMGRHFVTFERETLSGDRVITWFRWKNEKDEFVSGSDDSSFHLDDLSGMHISEKTAERGHAYYTEDRVRYICVDGTKGYAIVQGSDAYEVEFAYKNGEISQLVCSCFCSNACKHEFAAMMQLRETLREIEQRHAEEYARTGYFASISQSTLFSYAIVGKEDCTITL